jgi:prephenate dehydrogenase
MTRLAIVGFGLIGGSLALAARRARKNVHVTAIDAAAALARPSAQRTADAHIDVTDASAVARCLSEATLAVLSAPVSVICEKVAWTLEHAALVTDCGSTKRHVIEAARRSPRFERFVPGHPMAGLPEGGIDNASADLFVGRPWILCPEHASPEAVSAVEALVVDLGARPLRMSPEAHDRAVARTSHLPQLFASALSVLGESDAVRIAAGPAFERATRGAGGPEAIWRDIFETNGDEIARALRDLEAELSPIAAELDSGRSGLARRLLERARRWRAAKDSG